MADDEPPRRVQRVAAYAVVLRDRRLLMVRLNDRTAYPGAWTLPGGGIDFGEPPPVAVLRELHEETGLTGSVEALLGIQSAVRELAEDELSQMHAVRVLYRVAVAAEGPLVIHDVEGTTDAVEWVAIDDVRERWLAPLVGFALDRLDHPGAPA